MTQKPIVNQIGLGAGLTEERGSQITGYGIRHFLQRFHKCQHSTFAFVLGSAEHTQPNDIKTNGII